MDGAQLIAAERRRQVQQEGWSAEHDDGHTSGELSGAGASYAETASLQIDSVTLHIDGPDTYPSGDAFRPGKLWRWAREWWKPSDDPIRNLVKAGALIAAEIDRLQRRMSE